MERLYLAVTLEVFAGGATDHAAGDAVAGIAGGVGYIVVLAGVDHERGAGLLKQRARLVLGERDVLVDDGHLELAARRHDEVRHVAGVVAVGGVQTVLLLRRVEVRTGRGEGRLALADGVDVEGVLARREPGHGQSDPHARAGFGEDGFADLLAIGGLELGGG